MRKEVVVVLFSWWTPLDTREITSSTQLISSSPSPPALHITLSIRAAEALALFCSSHQLFQPLSVLPITLSPDVLPPVSTTTECFQGQKLECFQPHKPRINHEMMRSPNKNTGKIAVLRSTSRGRDIESRFNVPVPENSFKIFSFYKNYSETSEEKTAIIRWAAALNKLINNWTLNMI